MPVLVPYGRWMGADLETIALFSTVRGLMSMVSNMWMPRLRDRKGRKLVILISIIGSGVAYGAQGFAGFCPSAGAAIGVFMLGRALSGFFGGTMPVVRAYVAEMSMPDMALL